jgi:hypothetical protein
VFITLLVFSAATVQAATYPAAFPSDSTFYSSATNGTGFFVDHAGNSLPMWTMNDYVSQTFTGTGLNSVDSRSDHFSS